MLACLWWLVTRGAVYVLVLLAIVVVVLILAPLWAPDPRRRYPR